MSNDDLLRQLINEVGEVKARLAAVNERMNVHRKQIDSYTADMVRVRIHYDDESKRWAEFREAVKELKGIKKNQTDHARRLRNELNELKEEAQRDRSRFVSRAQSIENDIRRMFKEKKDLSDRVDKHSGSIQGLQVRSNKTHERLVDLRYQFELVDLDKFKKKIAVADAAVDKAVKDRKPDVMKLLVLTEVRQVLEGDIDALVDTFKAWCWCVDNMEPEWWLNEERTVGSWQRQMLREHAAGKKVSKTLADIIKK